ncbi:MAG: bacillithiol biosynthesis deacetylase BshB1 [Deltaproteobacteria bacterium]
MKLDVLAIGAHPDDVELSCGGTVIKLVKQGRKVGIVDLTEGELGTRGTAKVRRQEAAEAARILGVSARECLNLQDGNIELSMANRLSLVRAIREFQPEVLLIPYAVDRHPDHERAFTLCREAWFSSGLAKVETTAHGVKQSHFRPRSYYCFMQWHEFTPSFIVDITDEYDQRMEAVKAFRSQFHDPSSKEPETVLSSPEFIEMLRARYEYYGDRIGKKYGEPFFSYSMISVPDIYSLGK